MPSCPTRTENTKDHVIESCLSTPEVWPISLSSCLNPFIALMLLGGESWFGMLSRCLGSSSNVRQKLRLRFNMNDSGHVKSLFPCTENIQTTIQGAATLPMIW